MADSRVKRAKKREKQDKKKDKTMKKNTFVTGAFIATLSIVVSKILGIVYVIPFHAVIGEKGGALYGYAYSIYLVFISLSSAGIPLAISRIISEYQTLGYMDAKRRAFAIGKKIAWLLGFVCFIILMFCAPFLAKWILGDITGGNTIEDVTFVIRVIASAILVVPILSIYRGYFEGHRIMSPPSISQVIEQIVRVFVIVLGSFLTLKVFKLSLTTAVGVAVFGATMGAFVSYVYLVDKKSKNKDKLEIDARDVKEPIITDKEIFKKLLFYAVPFILIDIFKSLYGYVDVVTVIKGLVNLANFTIGDAEIIMSIISTWGNKFNMIILAVSTGIIVSLIPNLTKSVVEEKKYEINARVNQALSILLFLMLPMTVGISFLAKAIWVVFYGTSKYGANVLTYYIFIGLISGIFTAVITMVQTLKDYKTVFISLLVGIIIKIILNNKLIFVFYKMGFPAYYGVITASVLAYLVPLIICLIVLNLKYKIKYEKAAKNTVDIIFTTVLMLIVLFVFKIFVPVVVENRLLNILVICFYTLVGSVVYFSFAKKMGIIKNVFGDSLDKIFKLKR